MIFALEDGQVWWKSDFSKMNLWYKNIAKNGSNNDFLEPKMVSDLVFHVTWWTKTYKTTKTCQL